MTILQTQNGTHEADTIGFLGPEGSFTHQATLKLFSHDDKSSLIPQPSIAQVFAAVSQGQVSRGVVPLENSTNGAVIFTVDLLVDNLLENPNVQVVGEVYLRIHHCLVGRRRRRRVGDQVQEGTNGATSHDFANVKQIYSHPQAWGQCTKFLDQYLSHAQRHDVSSTAAAAGRVSQRHESTNQDNDHGNENENEKESEEYGYDAAAIASRNAVAEHANLEIWADEIEDEKTNTTRFLVLSSTKTSEDVEQGGQWTNGEIANDHDHQNNHDDQPDQNDQNENLQQNSSWKTLLRVSPPLDEEETWSLGDFLAGIPARCVNIHSRPSGRKPFHNVFLIELAGVWTGDRSQEAKAKSQAKAQAKNAEVKWLGSWKSADHGR